MLFLICNFGKKVYFAEILNEYGISGLLEKDNVNAMQCIVRCSTQLLVVVIAGEKVPRSKV